MDQSHGFITEITEDEIDLIVEFSAQEISDHYRRSRLNVPFFTRTDSTDTANNNVNLILIAMQDAMSEIVPEQAIFPLKRSICERIFSAVYFRLRLAPLYEWDQQGRVMKEYTATTLIRQDKRKKTADITGKKPENKDFDREFSSLRQKYLGHMRRRYDYLEKFFDAKNENGTQKVIPELVSCFIDIRSSREELIDCCIDNGHENPFDFMDNKDGQKTFATDDETMIAKAWRIFHISHSERFLAFRFLPEGTREDESSLFYFSLKEADFLAEDQSFSTGKISIYEKIYERKLLIYYYACTASQEGKTQQEKDEINYQTSILTEEIMNCKKHVFYSVPVTGTGSIEGLEEDDALDISHIERISRRIKAFRQEYTAVRTGYHVSQIFYGIDLALQLFLEAARGYISQKELPEKEKSQIIDRLRLVLHDKLYRGLNDLGTSQEEPIIAMRQILNETLEFLPYKEIDS